MEKNFIKIYADFLNKFLTEAVAEIPAACRGEFLRPHILESGRSPLLSVKEHPDPPQGALIPCPLGWGSLRPTKPLKIIFDCSNGTTGEIFKYLKTEKFKAVFINNKPDGNFSAHGPNPLKSGALQNLKSAVKKRKSDIGIIFDADGDRAFFIDNLGRFVDPDIIARLLIWHLKPKKIVIDAIAGNLLRNSALANLKIIESKVGHFYIKKLMRKTKADFGCERSGHYYFKNFFYADSGILAAIEVINAVSKLPYSLADFNDLLPQYYRLPELNFKVENPEQFIKKIENKFKNQTIKISRLDGLAMEFENWRFNLRSSNTEPLLRLNIEADLL